MKLANLKQQPVNCKFIAVKLHFFVRAILTSFLLLGLIAFNYNANATTYYLTAAGAGSAQTPGNWNTIPGGGGTAATNFTTTGDIFNIPVGISGILGASITIGSNSATSAILQIEGTLTINTGITLTIAGANSTSVDCNVSGTIIFGATALVNLSNNSSSNDFVLASGANLKTANTAGVTGTSCSITKATSATVTLNSGANFEFNGSADQATLGLPATVNQITISNSGAANNSTVTLPTGGAGITISNGLIMTSGILNLNAQNVSCGSLSGGATIDNNQNTTGTYTITVGNSNNLSSTFSGVIKNTRQTVTLTKAGTGTLTLSGANNYDGVTAINAGILNIQNNTATGATAGGVTVASGAALEVQGGITVGAEALTLNGTGISGNGALRNISGGNTWGGTITLAAASTIQSDAGSITLTAANSINATNINVTLQGAGNGNVNGTITTGTGTLTKAGAGTWTLSGVNSYTGLTTISAGTLTYGASNVLSTGAVTVNGGIFNIASFNDAVGAVTLNSGAISGTTGVLTGTSYSLESGTVSAILAGGTGVPLTKLTGGTVTLSGVNTYQGITTINAGTLSVATIGNGGVAGNLGQATNAASNLVLGGGTLQYTGATASTDRAYTLTAGTTSSIEITQASNTLTIGGAGASTTGALIKIGTGTLLLSGNNAYTGGTTITSGTLTLGRTGGALADAGNVTLNGGTLRMGATSGFSETVNTLSLSAPSTIALGTGAHTLTFANSSGVSWSSTTLTITGWTGTAGASGTAGKIFFGAATGTLTGTQLAMISFTGYSTCAPILLSTGELVPAQGDASAASSTQTLCINTVLTNITHSTTLATGISNDGVSGANGLPTGVSATWASNVITISGTPTVAGVFSYNIPLTGACGNATGTITVNPNNTAGSPSSTPSICVNTALTAITIATTSATGISNAGVSGANGLPTGVSATWASNTITISGTPTTGGTFNYSIPLTGGCGSINATGTITVNNDVTGLSASASTNQCSNAGVLVTVSSSKLQTGTYTVSYKVNGSGSTQTASMSFSSGTGTGTFTTVTPSAGDTFIQITQVQLGSCTASALSISTTPAFTTTAPPNAASNNLTTTASGTDTGNLLGSTVTIIATQLTAGTYTIGYTVTNSSNVVIINSTASVPFATSTRKNRLQGSFTTGIVSTAGSYTVSITSVTSSTGCSTNVTGETAVFSVVASIFTNSNGTWDQQGVWSSNTNGGAGPDYTSGNITINHQVTFDVNASALTLQLDQLTIGGTGELIIASGQEFRLKDNVAAGVDLTIQAGGKLTIGSTTITVGDTYNGTLVFESGATHTGTSTTAVIFRTQSQYQHAFTTTEGIPPLATWASDATFEVIGYTSTALTFASTNWSQNLPNFTWNCPSQTADINLNSLLGSLNSGVRSVQGNININNTGTAILRFGDATDYVLTVPGNLNVNGSARFSTGPSSGNGPTVTLNVSNINYASTGSSWLCEAGLSTVNVSNSIALTAGTVFLSDGGSNINRSGATVNLTGNISVGSSAILSASSANNQRTGKINFTGTTTPHTYTATGTVSGFMQYEVIASNTVRTIDESALTSSSTNSNPYGLIVNSGATLIVESTSTAGAIQSGTSGGNIRIADGGRNFISGSIIEYGRTTTSAGQYIGSGHPSTSGVDCLINNTSGVTVSSTGSTVLIGGSLKVISGNLTMAENNVTVTQNIETSGGNILVSPRASGTMTTALRADGAFNMTGGNIQMTSSATVNAANTSLIINGDLLGTNNFSFSGANCQVTVGGTTRTFTRNFPISAATTLESLTMDVTGANTTLAIPQDLTLGNFTTSSGTYSGGLTLTNGNVDMDASLVVTTDATLTNGTLFFEGRSVEIQRNIVSSASGLFSANSSSTLSATSSFNGSTADVLYFSPTGNTLGTLIINRSVSGGGHANIQLISPVTISGFLYLTDGDLLNSASNLTMGSGSTIVRKGQSGFYTGSSNPLGASYNVIYNDYVNGTTGTSATTTSLSSGVELLGTGLANVTSELSGIATLTAAMTGTGALTVSNIGTQAATKTFDCSIFAVQMGSVLINNGTTLTAPSGTTFTLSGTAPNNFTNNGTFNFGSSASTMVFDGTSTISGNTTTFNHITLNGNRTLTAPSVIRVQGDINFISGSTFNHSNGNVELTGGNAQSITANQNFIVQATPQASGSAAATMHFYTITVNKSAGAVTLSTPLRLGHLLDIQTNTAVISNGNLILLSQNDDTAYDARIGPILANGSISGDVQVQRLKDANLYEDYKYIGSPAANVPFMAEMWRLNKYDPILGQWVKTYENMNWGVGYAAQTYASNVRLTFTGAIKTGDFNWTLSSGWNLIANPYPSAIRWADLTNSNKWILSSGVSYVIGITDNDVSGYPNYFRYLNGPTTWGYATINGSVIATGQAFWVYANAGGETITIKESAKVLDSDPTGNFYREGKDQKSEGLTISLNNGKMEDQSMLILNQNATEKFDFNLDFPKLWNPQMNVYLSSGPNEGMLMLALPEIQENSRIPVGIKVAESGDYELKFNQSQDFDRSLYLIDLLEGIAVSASSDQRYKFAVTDASQPIDGRFYLSLSPEIEIELESSILIYPNPAKDVININVLGVRGYNTVVVTDLHGTPLLTRSFSNACTIDMANYSQGMYIVKVSTAKGLITKKIVKND